MPKSLKIEKTRVGYNELYYRATIGSDRYFADMAALAALKAIVAHPDVELVQTGERDFMVAPESLSLVKLAMHLAGC